ncbi:PREDICTED: relaxin receptor 1-like [Nanorana parkeri]|uniref:relaxin receptor 1-like n=1 Tax=Nanorana parkeri TaxID=125878 RepID=UPI000854D699|nr:PREDICTED: relaxin receptor 1-like [Nanorana parkeri]
MILLLSIASLLSAATDTLMIPSNLDSGTCPLGQFPCGNLSLCLPQLLHCNGHKDCPNGADEDNCVDNSGWPKLFDTIQSARGNQATQEDETQDYECVLDVYPEECECRKRLVNCSSQGLHFVPAVSSNVTAFDLKDNGIKSLPDGVFHRYHHLEKLFLQNNELQTISRQAFSGLFRLKMLFLSDNQIEVLKAEVFKDLHSLEWLILDNNRVNNIHPGAFKGLNSLYFLYMLNNSISAIPSNSLCAEMPRLNWLDLEGNEIETIHNSVFQECITVLVLRRNKIQEIKNKALTQMHKLVDLDLSVNQIEALSPSLFANLQELQQLNISFNPLHEIPHNQFDMLPCLQSLIMEGIEVRNISNRMFSKMANLSHIYFKKFQYCSYAPHVRSCKPNSDGISSFENLLANILLRVFVWVMACVTCFGNLFVICMRSFIVTENCQHAMSIKSLCCADCLMGFYLFCLGAFDIKFQGEYNKHAQVWMESLECKMVGSLAMLSSEVSVLMLTYMTLEKYFCIVFPFSHFRAGRGQTLGALLTIWVLGFLITIIPFLNYDTFGNFYGRNGVCFPLQSDGSERSGARGYSVAIFLGLNLLAFVTIVFSYSSMFYSIHNTGAKTAERSVLSREVAIAKRFFFIVFTDALCWIPIFLLKAVSLTKAEIPGTITSWVVIFILPINSALNPILYTLTTSSFQEKLKQCLQSKRHQLQESSKSSFTLVSIHTNTA